MRDILSHPWCTRVLTPPENGPKRSKTVQNGPKRSKTVLDQVSAEATLASNGSRITSKTVVDRVQNLVFARRVLSTLDISPLKTLNVVLATRLPNLSCWSWYEENLFAKQPILAKQIRVFAWWQTLQLSKVWVHKNRKICVTPDVTADWCRELKQQTDLHSDWIVADGLQHTVTYFNDVTTVSCNDSNLHWPPQSAHIFSRA